jgi:pimeloyl-ACP methyl ester carboxylesterase
MRILRTPDERFQVLAEFPFVPHYCEIDRTIGPRLRSHYVDEHYVDEAPRDSDPVTPGRHVRLQPEIPGARNQRHVTIEHAGHYLQEDRPGAFARVVIEFMRANPRPH